VAHGRPDQANRTMRFEIDAVSSTGYLVQVHSALGPSAGWQKSATLAAPAAALAAAGWVMRSQVVFGQGKAQMLPGKTEGPDALRGCNITWPSWREVVALIVLGSCTASQRRKKICKEVESHYGDAAVAKLTQVKMFRICTGQPDAEPEPALRSLTSISTLSEEPNLPDSAELFRINTADPSSACSELSDVNTEVQSDEEVPRCEDQRRRNSSEFSNAEGAGRAGVEVALGTEDDASGGEAAPETMSEEPTAGLALPVTSETAPAAMTHVHQAIGPTAVQTSAYTHAPDDCTPPRAARSMTSGSSDFSPIKFSRAVTCDQPLPSRSSLSSQPLHVRLRESNIKLVGAPKDRIREIVNQLGQQEV